MHRPQRETVRERRLFRSSSPFSVPRLVCRSRLTELPFSFQSVPSDPVTFAAAYRASDTYARMTAERDAYLKGISENDSIQQEFKDAVADQKRKGVSKKSTYTVSFMSQVNALAKRQFQLKKQDSFSNYTGYATAILIAIIVRPNSAHSAPHAPLLGCCTPLTVPLLIRSPSSYRLERSTTSFRRLRLVLSPEEERCSSRCSSTYVVSGPSSPRRLIAYLRPLPPTFHSFPQALNSFSELPSMMMGRPILYKQTNYKFYRPGAFAIASAYAEIPFTLPRVLIFSIIVYFMAGFNYTAGAFFTFFLFVYGTFMG